MLHEGDEGSLNGTHIAPTLGRNDLSEYGTHVCARLPARECSGSPPVGHRNSLGR